MIALGLAPNNKNTPQLSASDLVNIYLEKSKDIFKPSIFRKIYTGFGLWGSRYSRKNYDSILSSIFKDNVLSELECNVFIPSYSLNDKKPIILSNYFAAQSKENDFYFRDVAAATSAAPTYFPPDTFTNLDGIDWKNFGYDLLAIEQEVADAQQAENDYMSYVRSQFLTTRRVVA